MTRLVGLPRSAGTAPTAVVAALLAPLGVAALLIPFRSSFPNTDAALVLVVVVVAIAASGRRIAGLLAAASAAAWFDFFLTRPYDQFTITHRADVETTLLLLVVGAAVIEIAARARRHRTVAAIDESYLSAIRGTGELVASGADPARITQSVIGHLTALLPLTACRFERSAFGSMPRLTADGRLRWGDADWDIAHHGMPHRPIELLAAAGGRAYGRFVLEFAPEPVPTTAALQVAAMLATQAAMSVEWSLSGLKPPTYN